MSAQDELPPGWSITMQDSGALGELYDAMGFCIREGGREPLVQHAWQSFGITREEYTTMLAAVSVRDLMEARADRAEAALAKVTAERAEARRELDRALLDMAAGSW